MNGGSSKVCDSWTKVTLAARRKYALCWPHRRLSPLPRLCRLQALPWDAFPTPPPWLFLAGSTCQTNGCWEVFCGSGRPETWWWGGGGESQSLGGLRPHFWNSPQPRVPAQSALWPSRNLARFQSFWGSLHTCCANENREVGGRTAGIYPLNPKSHRCYLLPEWPRLLPATHPPSLSVLTCMTGTVLASSRCLGGFQWNGVRSR